MKYAFGLGGLLVCVGVIVWIMGAPGGELDHAKSAIDARNKVEPMVNQITGHSADGSAADKSAALQPQYKSGQFAGLAVASVVPGGAYDAQWGLKPFDLIVQIGPHDLVRDKEIDGDMASALMVDALRQSQPLVVMRANQRVTLPLTAPATPADAARTPPPARRNALQDQLNAIQNVPTH